MVIKQMMEKNKLLQEKILELMSIHKNVSVRFLMNKLSLSFDLVSELIRKLSNEGVIMYMEGWSIAKRH